MSKRFCRGAITGLLALAVASPAATAGPASQPLRQTSVFKFTTQQPGASTGISNTIDYFNPNDPSAKPFAVDRVVLAPHPGTEIDTSVPAQCNEVQATADECPRGSRVGGGTIRLDQGSSPSPFPRRLAFDVDLFNTLNGLIFRLEGTNNPITTVTRARLEGNRLVTDVPPLPGGPPDNQTAIDLVDIDIRSISNRRGSYITTPPTCPSSGRWVNRATFFYDTSPAPGFETVQTVPTRSACASGSGGGDGREIDGTSGNDVLTGTDGDDVIRCGAGNDRVDARGGDDVVICGSGDDVVRGGSGDDRLFGESGDDELFGESGNDRLDGDTGNDRLVGGPGSDRFSEGPGNDSTSP